ncbi:hypothetical protein RHPLAN_36090 [Rhodoplanes sp. Z2-YC6860]|nr:hypothetical protein RHPLAN_36090 [Rhodoplanes sp. Z2-YC6860]
MFRLLGRRAVRMRAVIALIAAYALCVLAPHVALALSDGAMAVHCLNIPDDVVAVHDHAAMGHDHGAMHSHQDHGSAPTHHDHSGKSLPGDCCGVFCMGALANAVGVDVGHERIGSPEFAAPVIKLSGDEPDLPYRPPNV